MNENLLMPIIMEKYVLYAGGIRILIGHNKNVVYYVNLRILFFSIG